MRPTSLIRKRTLNQVNASHAINGCYFLINYWSQSKRKLWDEINDRSEIKISNFRQRKPPGVSLLEPSGFVERAQSSLTGLSVYFVSDADVVDFFSSSSAAYKKEAPRRRAIVFLGRGVAVEGAPNDSRFAEKKSTRKTQPKQGTR